MKKLIIAISFGLVACEHDHMLYSGNEITQQDIKTLILPDGRSCEGTLHFTGGGYAEIRYNFHCTDGRMFVGLENAEVK